MRICASLEQERVRIIESTDNRSPDNRGSTVPTNAFPRQYLSLLYKTAAPLLTISLLSQSLLTHEIFETADGIVDCLWVRSLDGLLKEALSLAKLQHLDL